MPSWSAVAQPLIGLVVFTATALVFSEDRRAVSWRVVAAAMGMQVALGLLLLRVPVVADGFALLTRGVNAFTDATRSGTSFVFGYLGGGAAPFDVTDPGLLVTFAFQVLPIVIVVSALSAILWQWRILPAVIRVIAALFARTLGTRGPAGLVATANIFLGQVEAPLLVRPYIATMTRYELLLLMTAGMSTIAGSVLVIYASMLGPLLDGALGHLLAKSVMAIPAAILFAHVLIPETTPAREDTPPPALYRGTMDALTQGTSDGLQIYLGILAMLLVLVSLVAMLNGVIGLAPDVAGSALTLQRVAGWLFSPIAWCMGVPWAEATTVGSLLGIKAILNEFVAFIALSGLEPGVLSERSVLIATYALGGFANFGSVGVVLGGVGTMVPERRADLSALAPRALLAATLGNCMSGAIVALVG